MRKFIMTATATVTTTATVATTETVTATAAGASSQNLDPDDLLDPVNILAKLPNDFYEKVEAKKWQERHKAVEAVEKLLQAPKLKTGCYDDLVRTLVKIVSKDSNVMIVATAGKCLAALANGLTECFQQYTRICVPALLEKLKDKKESVLAAIREALDAIFYSTSLEVMKDDILEALNNKHPAVRAETIAFLVRSFTRSQPAAFNKKLLKAYTGALLKTINDADFSVRFQSTDALGTLMKLVGDKAIAPFLADLDTSKITKIKRCCDKAVIVGKVPRAYVVPSTSANKPTTTTVEHALVGDSESGLHADVLSAAVARVSEAQLPLVMAALEQLVTSLRTQLQLQLWTPQLEDSFMTAVATQLRLLALRDPSEPNVLPTYRALLVAIAAFYDTNTLGTKVSINVLKYTMYQLIKLLGNNKLGQFESGAYNKHIELQCVKILKLADHTNITCALIRLLRECTMSEIHERCLVTVWCLVQDVPTWPLTSINLDIVFYECHMLIEQYPNYASCNIIWMLVHSLANIPGAKVHIRRESFPEHSQFYGLLLNIVTAPQPHSISQHTKQALLIIFNKIRSGCKEEAFSELYNWMQKHPDTDLEPYLQNTCPAYRSYIKRGLATAAEKAKATATVEKAIELL